MIGHAPVNCSTCDHWRKFAQMPVGACQLALHKGLDGEIVHWEDTGGVVHGRGVNIVTTDRDSCSEWLQRGRK
jgi:hypothetical protein